MFQLQQKSKDPDEPAQLKTACRSHSFFLFSHHISTPLESQPVHGERKANLAVTLRLLWQHHPTTRPHAFPGTTHPGQCNNLTPPSQAPNPSGRSPSPYNPMTCSASLHTLFSPETLDETLSSSDQASSSLSHVGLSGQPKLHMSPNPGVRQPLFSTLPSSAIRCMPISAHFLRTSAEK